MATIVSLGSGIKEFTFAFNETATGNAVTVRFNPTNMLFAEKLFSTFDDMDAIGEKYVKKLDETTDSKSLFAITRAAENDMREKLNSLFGTDFCTPLFGEYESVYASDGDGLPVWATILLATIDEIGTSFVAEKEKTNPRIKKYTEKYNRRRK